MTNYDKRELRQLAKQGYSLYEIKEMGVDCHDATIRNYIKVFRPIKKNKKNG